MVLPLTFLFKKCLHPYEVVFESVRGVSADIHSGNVTYHVRAIIV